MNNLNAHTNQIEKNIEKETNLTGVMFAMASIANKKNNNKVKHKYNMYLKGLFTILIELLSLFLPSYQH